MPKYEVNIVLTKDATITVEATDEDNAVNIVSGMTNEQIKVELDKEEDSEPYDGFDVEEVSNLDEDETVADNEDCCGNCGCSD